MKKVLLIMTDMECGGVQISLLNFINALMKENVDITLLLDDASGEWIDRIPSNIKIRTVKYVCEGYHKLLRPHKKVNWMQDLIYHVVVHLVDKLYPNKEERSTRYTFLLNHIETPTEKYDIAIDYHGYGFFTTSILAQKIIAKRKAVFIHDENMDCMRMAECDLHKIDKFYSVSKSCQRIFEEKFPELKDKSDYFPNIIDVEGIKRKAEYPLEEPLQHDVPVLITVGRVMYQKGYDFAVEVAEELKKRNFRFRWYCVGDGMCMNDVKALIMDKHLEKEFVMLGRKNNPYPYINAADLYVQTSRHEGFGLAIAEALILGKVVLSTDMECVREQINDSINGYIEKMDVCFFADRIISIFSDKRQMKLVSERATQTGQSGVAIEKIFY